MKRSLMLCIKDKMSLDLDTIPKNHGALVGATDDLAVWKLVKGSDVGQLKLTELSDLSLELKACESICHLPELDMRRAGRENDVVRVRRKTASEDFS